MRFGGPTSNPLVVACLGVLLGASLVRADTVSFVSDTTWDTYDSDPSQPGAVLLGAAAATPCCALPSPISGATRIWAPGVTATSPQDLAQYFFARTISIPGAV